MAKVAAAGPTLTALQDQRLAQAFERERGRLLRFIRCRVDDLDDADDLLQDVLYELVRAERLFEPIEQVGAWLIRVARNRIVDRFRAGKPQRSTADVARIGEDGEMLS